MKKDIGTAIKLFAAMTVILGVIYPLFVTGVAQLTFAKKADGSLIIQDGKTIGSELIGQKFDSDRYFWSRPSASDYGAVPSGASNLGPTSEKLKKQVQDREQQFRTMNELADSVKIPSEMLFASASGLDPDISPKAALLQVYRISKVRKLKIEQKQQLVNLVNELAEQPQFSFFGEPRINVLRLNLALDEHFKNN